MDDGVTAGEDLERREIVEPEGEAEKALARSLDPGSDAEREVARRGREALAEQADAGKQPFGLKLVVGASEAEPAAGCTWVQGIWRVRLDLKNSPVWA